MLNLTLLRHAKSEINGYDGTDFTRDISEAGVKQTKKIGNFIRDKKISFDEVLCSPSLRTKKTLDVITSFFANKPMVKVTANPFTAALPKANSTIATINVVTLASTIVENALL